MAALALFFGVSPGLAQTGTIEGTVRDAAKASPVNQAQVLVVGTTLEATTNENGYYQIADVPIGTYDLRVLALGFNPVTITNARLTAGLPLTLNFEVLPAVINLDAVVVTGVLAIAYLLTVLAVAIVFLHRLVGPTVALRRQGEALKNGDYSARVSLRRNDAFSELADDLNELAALLEQGDKPEESRALPEGPER